MLVDCIELIMIAQIFAPSPCSTSRGTAGLPRIVARQCAQICDACAKECEKHAAHMEHCRVCAEICRKCADECRKVAAADVMRLFIIDGT